MPEYEAYDPEEHGRDRPGGMQDSIEGPLPFSEKRRPKLIDA